MNLLFAVLQKNILIGVTFTIGFVSLFLETVSFNIAYLYVTENSYVAAIVLSAFLGGVYVATLLISLLDKKNRSELFAFLVYIHFATGIYILTLILYPKILGTILHFVFERTGLEIINLGVIWFFLFIPGFLVGAVLPIVLAIVTQSQKKAISSISSYYSVDILGGVIGTLVAGFIFIPVFGITSSLLLPLALVTFVILLLNLQLQIEKNNGFLKRKVVQTICLMLIGGLCLATIIYFLNFNQGSVTIPYENRFGTIVYQKNSPFGVVTIGDRRGYDGNSRRTLFINYRDMCISNNHEAETFIAEVATDNINDGDKVLTLGLGCGFTARSLLDSKKISELHLYEINPVIAESSTEYFFSDADDPLQDARVSLLTADGLHAVRNTQPNQYGAVVIDVEEPGVIQSSPLYTVEYLERIRGILQSDGIFSMWAIKGGNEYNKILYKTVASVFGHTYLVIDQFKNVQIFASDKVLDVPGGKNYNVDELAEVPINRLFNNALAKNYSISKSFSLPEYFNDPMITGQQ